MMKKLLKTYLNKKTAFYILGLLLLALGIRFIIESDLGAAPWDLLCLGLYEKTGISIGSWQIINNIAMIVVTRLVFKQNWNIVCLIPGVLLGIFIDMFAFIAPLDAMNSYAMLMIGCVLSGLGLAIYMNQGLSSNAIDNFVYTMNKVKKVSPGKCKIVCDSIPLIIIIGLSIHLQIATILVYVLVPICMQVCTSILKKTNVISFA